MKEKNEKFCKQAFHEKFKEISRCSVAFRKIARCSVTYNFSFFYLKLLKLKAQIFSCKEIWFLVKEKKIKFSSMLYFRFNKIKILKLKFSKIKNIFFILSRTCSKKIIIIFSNLKRGFLWVRATKILSIMCKLRKSVFFWNWAFLAIPYKKKILNGDKTMIKLSPIFLLTNDYFYSKIRKMIY